MEFIHNRTERCFQAWENGAIVGELHYRLTGAVADFDHTSVPSQHEGKGIAGRLVQFAVDEVRAQEEWKITATCPYVVRWLERHRDYADIEATPGDPAR